MTIDSPRTAPRHWFAVARNAMIKCDLNSPNATAVANGEPRVTSKGSDSLTRVGIDTQFAAEANQRTNCEQTACLTPLFKGLEALLPSVTAIACQCEELKAAIQRTCADCPGLLEALPHLEEVKTWPPFQANLGISALSSWARHASANLGQIARYWGYLHPQWLQEHLPLIGFCHNKNPGCEAALQKIEFGADILSDLCLRATLVGCISAIEVILKFIPTNALIRWHRGEENFWIYLQFAHKPFAIPAVRMHLREHWAAAEWRNFALAYGKRAADQLAAISPAFNQFNPLPPLSDAERAVLIMAWQPFYSGSPPQPEEDASVLSLDLLENNQTSERIDDREKWVLNASPSAILPEFRPYAPIDLNGWRWHTPPQAQKKPLKERHLASLAEMRQAGYPKAAVEQKSPVGAAAELLFGWGALATKLHAFCRQFLQEAESGFKSSSGLLEALAESVDGTKELNAETVAEARVRQVCGTVASIALLSSFYDVQLQVCCRTAMPERKLRAVVRNLKLDLSALGLKIPISDRCAGLKGQGAILSAICNPKRPWKGQVFALEEGLGRGLHYIALQKRVIKPFLDLDTLQVVGKRVLLNFSRKVEPDGAGQSLAQGGMSLAHVLKVVSNGCERVRYVLQSAQ